MLLQIWLWCGLHIFGFKHVDIYSPDEDEVVGMTFSISEDYLDKIKDVK